MEIGEYILLINKLRAEKVERRAIVICRKLMKVGFDRNIDTQILSEIYKELMDNGVVNQDNLNKYKEKVSSQWSIGARESISVLGLETEINILRGEDINFVDVTKI